MQENASNGYPIRKEIWNFVHQGLDSCFTGETRYSSLLAKQLAFFTQTRSIDAFEVLGQISRLEGIPARVTPTKKEERFKKPPLKGLWKKHFFQASFLPRNLLNQTESGKHFKGVMRQFPAGSLVEDIVDKMLYDLVLGGYKKKVLEQSLTGEWIIFARHEGKNHYLTLGTHGNDSLVRDFVDQTVSEFPFLEKILV